MLNPAVSNVVFPLVSAMGRVLPQFAVAESVLPHGECERKST
ncbi:MAG TPA: hypothetical protein VKX17_27280 [Planctomycetota bacterium]|nr:hypothetical protein [Planctomycetota bacterium]